MKKNAFSLVEISIVLVIISILIAGIMEGRILIRKAKISDARLQTTNSPVANIGGLLLWYETLLEESFDNAEAKDSNAISTWYDLNPNVETVRNNATQTTAANRPIYKTNRINGLPAISFTRTNSNFLSFDGTPLANSAYTIFIVEQRTSNDADNTFIGGTSIADNSSLSFSYQNESIVIDQGNNQLSKTIFTAYTTPTPRIHSVNFNFATKKYYVNGVENTLNGSGSAYDITKALVAFPGASLGAKRPSRLEKYFQGDIGEVIIFKKSLSNDERISVEKYLSKKWSIKIYAENYGTCNGVVTVIGCEASCPVSIVGVSSPSSVKGGTSGTLICKSPEYNDTIPYTCPVNGGNIDIGSNICDVCASGYSYYNSICQGPCSVSGINGIINGTSVQAGSNSVSCNDTANNYSGSVSGICDAGVFTPNSGQACGCAPGYQLSGGTCVIITCNVSIAGVTSPSTVNAGSSGTFTCKTPEYNDTIPYTCSLTGTLNIGSESCNVCASGYSYYNSICQGPCSVSGINGIINGTSVQAGSNSVSCNNTANNYSGSVSGICDAGVFTPNSGQACGCASGYQLVGGVCAADCTGGVKTTYTDGGGVLRRVHTFTNTVANPLETFQCPNNRNVDILVVGGGGGGSNYYDGGGGGGGGGVVYTTGYSVTASTSYNITVGPGGNRNTTTCNGSNGGSSKFGTIITAVGGGGGGGHFYSGSCSGKGATGASGGGGGRDAGVNSGGDISANTFPSGAISYGNKGGYAGSSWSGGGGGGGAVNVGGNGSGGSASAEKGGTGGPGVQISISGASPTPYYGAGGGGGVNGSSYVSPGGSSGNTGAGGNGGARGYIDTGTPLGKPRSSAATDGANGYGSGGGGSHPNAPNGGKAGNGGSGVVIISY